MACMLMLAIPFQAHIIAPNTYVPYHHSNASTKHISQTANHNQIFGLLLDNMNVEGAARAARKGADTTAKMEQAEAGRSNYISKEVLMGTPDPGAVAVAIVLETISAVI